MGTQSVVTEMADASLWPVIVGGLLTLAGTAAVTIAGAIRDNAQQRREEKQRRADKFEELIKSLYEFDHWLDLLRQRVLGNVGSIAETPSPFAKVQSITSIYFPQFVQQVRELDAASSIFVAWIYNPHTIELPPTGKPLIFGEVYQPYVKKREALLDALSEAVRDSIK